MKDKRPRWFFVVDGPDGIGQTTQVGLLAAFFIHLGYEVWETCEPTDSEYGKRIRRIFGGQEAGTVAEAQELFLKDRELHVVGINDCLARGIVVISARYRTSMVAFGAADGSDKEDLIRRNEHFLEPTKTFYLDVPVEEADDRIEKRGENRELPENVPFQIRVKAVYEELLEDPRFPDLVRIDGTGDKYTVHLRILTEVIEELLAAA